MVNIALIILSKERVQPLVRGMVNHWVQFRRVPLFEPLRVEYLPYSQHTTDSGFGSRVMREMIMSVCVGEGYGIHALESQEVQNVGKQ